MKDGPCGYCRGVRLVGWSGAGPILCPRCCEHNEDVFAVVTQAWREQRTCVVEFEAELATLRAPVDAFFEAVLVNDPDAAVRANRLNLLAKLRDTMRQVADFSKVAG